MKCHTLLWAWRLGMEIWSKRKTALLPPDTSNNARYAIGWLMTISIKVFYICITNGQRSCLFVRPFCRRTFQFPIAAGRISKHERKLRSWKSLRGCTTSERQWCDDRNSNLQEAKQRYGTFRFEVTAFYIFKRLSIIHFIQRVSRHWCVFRKSWQRGISCCGTTIDNPHKGL